MTNYYQLCEDIARKAHKGQVRRGGEPYIKHPLTVSYKFAKDEDKCVAILHDVIEDTKETAKSLLKKGVPQEIVDKVVLLTKKRGQDYDEYILAIKADKELAKIKIQDILNNMFDDPTEKQLEKYKKSLKVLLDGINQEDGK